MFQIRKLFLDRRFVHYSWIGAFISVVNITLLWLAIDVIGIPTLIASAVIIGSTFLVRYVMFAIFRVL